MATSKNSEYTKPDDSASIEILLILILSKFYSSFNSYFFEILILLSLILKRSIKKCISRQCIKMGYPPPEMETKVDDIGLTVAGITFWCKNIEKASSNLELMGNALQRVALFVLNQVTGSEFLNFV